MFRTSDYAFCDKQFGFGVWRGERANTTSGANQTTAIEIWQCS